MSLVWSPSVIKRATETSVQLCVAQYDASNIKAIGAVEQPPRAASCVKALLQSDLVASYARRTQEGYMETADAFSSRVALATQPHILDFLVQRFDASFRARISRRLSDILNSVQSTAENGRWAELYRVREPLAHALVNEPTIESEPVNSQLQTILLNAPRDNLKGFDPIYLDDVVQDLQWMDWQLRILAHVGLPCPASQFGVNLIPTPLPFLRGHQYNPRVLVISDQLEVHTVSVQFVPLDRIASLMSAPLSFFLGARLFGSTQQSLKTGMSQVEVRSKEHGWQVIYSPIYKDAQLGFGGPTTPVTGHIHSGTYRFGISSSEKTCWHETDWVVPRLNPIYLPLP
jgi:hypothetical protein